MRRSKPIKLSKTLGTKILDIIMGQFTYQIVRYIQHIIYNILKYFSIMRMVGAAAGVWPSYNGYLIAYPLLTAGPHQGLYNYYLSSLSLPLSPLFSSTISSFLFHYLLFSLPLSPLFSSTISSFLFHCLLFSLPLSVCISSFPVFLSSLSPPFIFSLSSDHPVTLSPSLFIFNLSQYLCRFSLCHILLIICSFPASFP
jgi:hypothetical protein